MEAAGSQVPGIKGDSKKLVIVGGVAGGISAAAQAWRISESAEILLLERGPDVSFSNCGLPYYVGGEIAERAKLLAATPVSLRQHYRLDVRIRSEVVAIDQLGLPGCQWVGLAERVSLPSRSILSAGNDRSNISAATAVVRR